MKSKKVSIVALGLASLCFLLGGCASNSRLTHSNCYSTKTNNHKSSKTFIN